jgi:dTDP-4-dehydrorhamnose reductase
MKILITGANGYVGTTFYQSFKDKYDVTTLTKEKVDLINTENVKNFFKDKYFDVVIHCAIVGGGRLDTDDPKVLDSNLKMFYNLVECDSSFGKLIHFGSGGEKQNTFYGLSKKVINESIKNKDKFYNVRILAVFDENELEYKFVKSNITNYINKKDIYVFQNKYMDFFYMKDLITLIEHYINNNNLPKVIDCCYNYSPTLYDVSQIINNLGEHKVNIKIENWEMAPPFNGEFIDLGLEFIGLEQGIKNVYNKIKSKNEN